MAEGHGGHCVVCGAAIEPGAEIYANSWESVRQVSPCCSEECAGAFNPDRHWFPRQAPEPMPEEEERRMLELARGRLFRGEQPEVVVRDLLTSGANPHAVRALCMTSERGTKRRVLEDQAHEAYWGGPLGLLLGGLLRRANDDGAEQTSIELALDDLDGWERRFPSTRRTER